MGRVRRSGCGARSAANESAWLTRFCGAVCPRVSQRSEVCWGSTSIQVRRRLPLWRPESRRTDPSPRHRSRAPRTCRSAASRTRGSDENSAASASTSSRTRSSSASPEPPINGWCPAAPTIQRRKSGAARDQEESCALPSATAITTSSWYRAPLTALRCPRPSAHLRWRSRDAGACPGRPGRGRSGFPSRAQRAQPSRRRSARNRTPRCSP